MKQENVTVIVTGGDLSSSFLKEQISNWKNPIVIAADRGMEVCLAAGIVPDHVIGDFDSIEQEAREKFLAKCKNVTKLNPIKDDTDTEAALHLAFEKTRGDIYLLGATGTRLDHVLANIAILGQGIEKGRQVFLLDANNRIRLVEKECRIRKDEQYGSFISVIPFGGNAKGVRESGVFYPLDHVEMPLFTSWGISNEITEEEAVISVEDGVLLLVESKD